MTDYRALENEFGLPLQPKRDLVAVRGQGALLYDENGQEYIDFAAGIAVASLGHSHPRLVTAIQQQAATLITCPNIMYNDVRSELLKKLVEVTPRSLTRAYLCNSGAESIEAALKFARLHTGRTNFVTAMRGFHGRTMGAVSATHTPKYREAFLPLIPGFDYVPFNKIERLDAAVDDNTAAVMIELVQGEGGVNPVQADYAAAAREICSARGALLIIDEIQTGFCRTGRFFACDHFDLLPDMMCVAKAMAGGVPIGATLLNADIHVGPGLHGTTFGGNPLACAAALAAIDVYQSENLAQRAAELGDYFEQRLNVSDLSQVRALRRLGLMIGIELKHKVQDKLAQLLERRIIALPAGPNVIRLLPPLVVEKEQIDTVTAALRELLA
ncbi:MAG: acetylornithine/succinylornithine family transaminase [Gammaproteobacteria bacterium]|nr:acetylornithine/succinylornithine family transaminase [Gammaproteobacteria bacterium]MDH3536264.1 acetylornithine/succinylornithine family transaminase [Gammaproteobacteria bacterium]